MDSDDGQKMGLNYELLVEDSLRIRAEVGGLAAMRKESGLNQAQEEKGLYETGHLRGSVP